MSQGQWPNEKVLEFLELYQAEPVLWNPVLQRHKNRNAAEDAWQRIKVNLNTDCTLSDLKKKKESLMSTYRLYNKKIKDSIRSGTSTDDVFRTNWFAYNLMDSFLAPIYNKENTNTINTETVTFSNENEMQAIEEENGDIAAESTSTLPTKPTSAKRRREPELMHARRQMDEAVNILKTISERSKREPDEVDLFCQLLAKKIKKFDETGREQIMDEINTLLYHKQQYRNWISFTNTLSPQSSTSAEIQFPILSLNTPPQPDPSLQTRKPY